MSDQKISTNDLQLKRAKMIDLQERERLRAAHGSQLANIVASVTGKAVSLVDFDMDAQVPSYLEWPEDIAAAPGLVAAYISNHQAVGLLQCFRKRLPAIDGLIGFHDKHYLGFCALKNVDPTTLLTIAEEAGDSVLFYVENPQGVILVDCYDSDPDEPFSVVVQGEALVDEFAQCFIGDTRK